MEKVTAQFMHELWLGGLIGTKELRSWLAKVDPVFGEVRDGDVDNEIDRLARERAAALRARTSEEAPE